MCVCACVCVGVVFDFTCRYFSPCVCVNVVLEIYLYIYIYIYMFIFIRVCVCVCVCVRFMFFSRHCAIYVLWRKQQAGNMHIFINTKLFVDQPILIYIYIYIIRWVNYRYLKSIINNFVDAISLFFLICFCLLCSKLEPLGHFQRGR